MIPSQEESQMDFHLPYQKEQGSHMLSSKALTASQSLSSLPRRLEKNSDRE